MNWLNRAEGKFGHLAISGLPRIIVGFNALVYVLYKINPGYLTYLDLRPELVMQGQVWRLLTYLFIPGFGGIFGEVVSLILYLLYLLFIGTGLERAMGAFKLNVYYLVGMVGVTITSFLFRGADFAPGMLNSTLFFAFARYFPELVIYVMFILPVKVKWMAWLSAAGLLFGFVSRGWDYRSALLVCLGNYLLFFGAEHVREARHRTEVSTRRQRFEADKAQTAAVTLHECTVCQRTENTDPYLDFRVARDGQEYCTEHLPRPVTGAA